MPVDTDLTVQPAQIASPLDTIGKLANLRGQQAEIALRNAQTQQAGVQTQDLAAQAQQRNRDLADQNYVQKYLGAPGKAQAIGAAKPNDPIWSEISGKVQPKTLLNLQTNVLAHQTSDAALTKDKLLNNASLQGEAEKAFNGLLYPDGANPTTESSDQYIAANLPGVRARLIGLGIADSAIPSDIKTSDQLKSMLTANAYLSGVNKTAQEMAKTVQETATSAAAGAKDQADADLAVQQRQRLLATLPADQAEAQTKIADAAFRTAHGGLSADEVRQGQQTAAGQAEAARHNTKTEGVAGAEQNLRQKQFDATFGAGLDANGKPLSADEFKQAAAADPVAKAIAEYQIPGPPAQTRGGVTSPILRKVMALNPSYDGTQFQARNKVQQDFSASGASGKLITSADTALAHLNAISMAGKALDNNDIPLINRIANSYGVQEGKTPKQTYDTITSMVAPEISKAVIGAAGGEGERVAMQKNFSSDASNAQREGAIQAAAQLLGARVHKQAQAYESTMGAPLDLTKRLSQESQAVMQKYSAASGGSSAGGHVIQIGAKHYQYKGTGNTADLSSYTEVK